MSSAEPTPAEQFLRNVLRSGLLARDDLRDAVRPAPPAVRQSPEALADYLVKRGKLSHYQATKLLQGTWQGLVLGPYQVLAPLGRGGMGTVYLARDTRGPALAALKILPPKKARQEERALARFLREMELARKVSHPNLTQTYDVGVIQGVYYIAMEYIPGQSLHRLVTHSGPLSVGQAARLFAEVSAGLGHVHVLGLIHRDLKPSNIMVTPNRHAKLLDLGLAIELWEELPQDKKIVGGSGYILGTMDYIAPEQAEDATKVSPQSDLYAMGCSLYFTLSGRPPFPGGTSVEKLTRHRTELPPPVTDVNPTVPEAFSLLVERLMAKDPALRPRSAEEVRRSLEVWAAEEPELPPDPPPQFNEQEIVVELEESHAESGSVWQTIPVIAFIGNTGSSAPQADARPPSESGEEEPAGGRKFPAVLLALMVVLGLAVLMLFAEMMRRM